MCARHCRVEFIKQVLPKFPSPAPYRLRFRDLMAAELSSSPSPLSEERGVELPLFWSSTMSESSPLREMSAGGRVVDGGRRRSGGTSLSSSLSRLSTSPIACLTSKMNCNF